MSPFVYGWGFRRTVQDWRFYSADTLAIDIHCRGGRRMRLGTTRVHQPRHPFL